MSKTTTITEALAELKVIQKRIDSKQSFILTHLARQEQLRDPLLKEGGAPVVLAQEMQSIHDLREQAVSIRRAIADANTQNSISLNGTTRSIADWLTWRRDVAPGARLFLANLTNNLANIRTQVTRSGGAMVSASASVGDTKPTDIVVNVSEVEIAKRNEELNAALETLDGQLSLKNATIQITY